MAAAGGADAAVTFWHVQQRAEHVDAHNTDCVGGGSVLEVRGHVRLQKIVVEGGGSKLQNEGWMNGTQSRRRENGVGTNGGKGAWMRAGFCGQRRAWVGFAL